MLTITIISDTELLYLVTYIAPFFHQKLYHHQTGITRHVSTDVQYCNIRGIQITSERDGKLNQFDIHLLDCNLLEVLSLRKHLLFTLSSKNCSDYQLWLCPKNSVINLASAEHKLLNIA